VSEVCTVIAISPSESELESKLEAASELAASASELAASASELAASASELAVGIRA
jgi:X-X-X-Leu-X-X-Gly heptad repeat protein